MRGLAILAALLLLSEQGRAAALQCRGPEVSFHQGVSAHDPAGVERRAGGAPSHICATGQGPLRQLRLSR